MTIAKLKDAVAKAEETTAAIDGLKSMKSRLSPGVIIRLSMASDMGTFTEIRGAALRQALTDEIDALQGTLTALEAKIEQASQSL